MHYTHSYSGDRLRYAALLVLHEEMQEQGREAGDPHAESEADAAAWVARAAVELGVESEVALVRQRLERGAVAVVAARVRRARVKAKGKAGVQ